MNILRGISILALVFGVVGCGDDGGDGGGGKKDSSVGTDSGGETGVTYNITFTNMSKGQLMTPPVVAIHDPSVQLFEVGMPASDEVRDVAETGSNDALVALAGGLDGISASGEAGSAPFGAGATVTTTLTTDESTHVFSSVNMVICSNDGITGFDSIALPTDATVTMMAVALDAGTRVNDDDPNTFFPGPCRDEGVDVEEADLEDPRANIAVHPGQDGIVVSDDAPEGADWDFDSDEDLIQIEISIAE